MTRQFSLLTIPVKDREIAIINYLRNLPPGSSATIREIWEATLSSSDDSVTVQAYHKIIDRLTAVGRVEQAGEDAIRGKLFCMAPYLHVTNPATQDQIYAWVTSSLPPSEVIANSVDAMDYMEEMKNTTLKRAAKALLGEDPVELFYNMLIYFLDALEADLKIYNHRHPKDQYPELREEQLIKRIIGQYSDLDRLLYRYFSVPVEVVDITKVLNGVKRGDQVSIMIDRGELKETLRHRIFGEKFIKKCDVSGMRDTDSWQRMSVAGTDGSTHSGILAVHTARSFQEDHDLWVTFNNSMAYVSEAPLARGRIPYPFHSVPMTRSALDDPNNRGMVLVPIMFQDLTDSEYEHMAKCATDVVQWRVDSAVFSGRARALSPEGTLSLQHGKLLPSPTVHLRDGTVTPQERELKHYDRMDDYGEFVREGIQLSSEIAERVKGLSNDGLRVFGGAVKDTQMRIFSRVINWYIAIGSKLRYGEPIDSNWDTSRAALVTDNEAMTALMSILASPKDVEQGIFLTSCVITRQFHSLTEHYKPELPEGENDQERWHKFFENYREHKRRQRTDLGGEVSFLELAELENDPFVWMCSNTDYGVFYVGHTGGEPAPLLPRYEFMDSLRGKTAEEKSERVGKNVEKLLQALDQIKLALDQDHNFMTNQRLVKIIPSVIYTAHEHGKALGKQLESELRSWIVARLQNIRKIRAIRPSDIELLPVPIKEYVNRYKKAIEGDIEDDPGSFIR
jgi:hypothetical protein